MRTIKVTGKGNLKVKPDMTRVTITLEGVYPEYEETLRKSAQDTECLKEVLGKLGFAKTDLKTLSFHVDTKQENYRDKNNEWKQRFVGYEFHHIMKLEFGSDNALLGKVLFALANAPVRPEFRLSYTVKDKEKTKNELLGRAVADAKEKAAVLAQAAGVTLNNLMSIDYSWGELDIEVRPMNRAVFAARGAASAKEESYDMDIEPDDIDISDTVTMVWEIA